MCGILGELVYKKDTLINKDKFIRLLNLSKQRGPDSQNYFSNNINLQMGFNRLSILDLSKNGDQPVHSPTKRYTMVFNGEIYNHNELRKKLPIERCSFNGHGDTETLINCFEIYGIIDTVKLLEGMFSIGIFDHFKSELHLIRDFAGIKPLFYGWNNETLIFSNQYNQVSRHPRFIDETYNEEVLKLYLKSSFIPSPYGILNNTFSVKPGEILTFDKNGKKTNYIYWHYPKYSDIDDGSDILEYVDNKLDLAVKEEMLSDVPLGAFLSGGVDSPLICHYAHSRMNKKLSTFTMGSDSLVHDETEQAREYSNYLQTDHKSIFITADNSLKALDKSIESAGEPFGDFSIIPTWQLSKFARTKIKVALSGDGGDELFFGYERFRSISKNHKFWNYPYKIRYYLRGFDKLLFNEYHLNECILASTPGKAHQGLHDYFNSDLLNKLAPDLHGIKLPIDFDIYNYKNPKTNNELLYKIRKSEFYGMLQKTLVKVDRASMANSLEVRVPFVNKKFVENIFKISINQHQATKYRKKILYSLLDKCYPNVKHSYTKLGFSVSLTNWIKQSFYTQFKDTLLDKTFFTTFGFNNIEIEKMLKLHLSGKMDFKRPLFSLYSLAKWNENGRKRI